MSETTLDEAVQAFAMWRAQRKGKARTPDHLKAMAISLLARYSMSEVCKRLVLNSGTLKSWGGLNQPDRASVTSDFVTLVPNDHADESKPGEISLTLSASGGIDCKLTGDLQPGFIVSLLQMMQGVNP